MKVAIGQDSHAFDLENKSKRLILAGVQIEGVPGLKANSDGDVVYHALTNAVSGITCVNILGDIADDMCLKKGITDSSEYLKESLKYLGDCKIIHVSISIECKKPKILPQIPQMRKNISKILDIPENCIGITATSGEGLTEFGKGNGIQVFCCITAV